VKLRRGREITKFVNLIIRAGDFWKEGIVIFVFTWSLVTSDIYIVLRETQNMY
jgi:hypothetical protein